MKPTFHVTNYKLGAVYSLPTAALLSIQVPFPRLPPEASRLLS